MIEDNKIHGVPLEEVRSLIVSAIEGGSNSWIDGEIIAREPSAWEHEDMYIRPEKAAHWYHDYPLNPGGGLIFRVYEDTETYILDLASIEKGLEILQERYPHYWRDIEDENADAYTGDAFLQCALFGELVYG